MKMRRHRFAAFVHFGDPHLRLDFGGLREFQKQARARGACFALRDDAIEPGRGHFFAPGCAGLSGGTGCGNAHTGPSIKSIKSRQAERRRYWIASAIWAALTAELSARSAMLRASLSTR